MVDHILIFYFMFCLERWKN